MRFPEVGPGAPATERQPHERRDSAPLPERFVEADGVTLRCTESGIGNPPVVLLHGDGSLVEDSATSGLLDHPEAVSGGAMPPEAKPPAAAGPRRPPPGPGPDRPGAGAGRSSR